MFHHIDRIVGRLTDDSVPVQDAGWREGDFLRGPGHSHPVLLIQSIDGDPHRVTVRSCRSGNWYVYLRGKLVATHINVAAEERRRNEKE